MLASNKNCIFYLKAIGLKLILLSFSILTYADSSTDSLIIVLKKELSNKKIYENNKTLRIKQLSKSLAKTPQTNLSEQYRINALLLKEYISYQRDSAIVISNKLIDIGLKAKNPRNTTFARLKLGNILVSSGLYKEASDCLALIDIGKEQNDYKFEYYHLVTWLNWAMQTSIGDKLYAPAYQKLEQKYRDSALHYADPKRYERELIGAFPDSTRANSQKNYRYYVKFLENFSKTDPAKTARLAYMLSDLYQEDQRTNLLLISSIQDVRNSTKETAAIVKVGAILFENGDVENSYLLLQEATDNAIFFGSKLHQVEISALVPLIAAKKMLQAEHKIMLVIILSMVLIFILVWVGYSRTRLKSLNNKISLQNIELQKTLEALEKSQRDNAWILKVLAHDLRGTIAGTIGVTGNLIHNEHLSEDERMMLELLEASNHDALETISDLLNVSTNTSMANRTNVELDKLVRESAKLLQGKADEKQQKLIAKASPITVPINREKIRRVLHNLISNAIKFSAPDSDIILEAIDKNEDYALIKITDNGIGIPEEFRATIFDLDPEIRREGTSGEQSFGLGLYICKQIIEEHKGKIWTESNNGKGTVLLIELPKV